MLAFASEIITKIHLEVPPTGRRVGTVLALEHLPVVFAHVFLKGVGPTRGVVAV